MNLQQWQTRIREQLAASTALIQCMVPGMTYGALATASLLPVIVAVKGGDITALAGVFELLGNVGAGLVTNLVQAWKDREEADTAAQLPAAIQALVNAPENDEARAAFDKLINALETVQLTLESQTLPDPATFVAALQQELHALGSAVNVEGDWLTVGNITDTQNVIIGRNNQLTAIGTQINNYQTPPPTPPRHDRYLHHLLNHCHALPITAMGGDATGGNDVTLDKVYIDLDTTTMIELSAADEADHQPPAQLDREENKQPLTARTAAQQQPRLVLLGAPGGGKSTFVRQLLAQLILARRGTVPAPDGFATDLFPMVTILRDLATRLGDVALDGLSDDERDTQLLACLHEQWTADLERFQGMALQDAWQSALQTGKVLLVFDGLDEMAVAVRPLVRLALSALCRRHPDIAHIIVTCRVRSYVDNATLPGFTAYTLADFSAEKVKAFVTAWYNAQRDLGRLDAATATRLAADLQAATQSTTLRSMATNPMLLTTMALLHQKETRLPDQRVELYDRAVEILLNRWQASKGVQVSPPLAAFLRDGTRVRPLLERLAYEAHRQVQKEVADLPRATLLTLLEEAFDGDMNLATEFLDYIDHRAGLLVGQGGVGTAKRPQSYTFPHRTFQEYLAGCHLLGQGSTQRSTSVARIYRQHAAEGDIWQVAALLGAEELFFNRRGESALLDLMYDLCPVTPPQDATAWRTALWSGQMAQVVGREKIAADQEAADGGATYLARLIPRLLAILRESPLPPIERAEAGRVLAKLGDPRLEVLDPLQIEWCDVPAGPFVMGSDEVRSEKPQHIFDIPYGYKIARYPVTNAQFQCFVDAKGYSQEAYWPEAKQHGYWTQEGIKGLGDDEPRRAPYHFSEPFNLSNHPVVGITWYEALAFTRWLNEQLHATGQLDDKWMVRLPTEAEWEKAARGDDGRRYPWPGDSADPNRANYRDTGIGTTSAVGAFPGGRSHCGAEEMAGNVLEWCGTQWLDNYEDYVNRVDESLDADTRRVWRGGSFVNYVNVVRAGYRLRNSPHYGNSNFGVRVVCCPHSL